MSALHISSLWHIRPGTDHLFLLDGYTYALWGHAWCPDRLVMAHFAPHEWRILRPMKGTSRITHGASGARFEPPGRPSRTQKCDAYCHNFMRPRRSTRHTVVTDISAPSLVFHFQVPLSLNFYSYFFKFCRIIFYEMHNYAEYYSETHKKCINMHIIV